MLRQHLNFRQISHRFTLSFANLSFQDLNSSHIMYWNMTILNTSRFKVEPHSKYWYFCIERCNLLLLRFSENAVLFHIEWLCRKTVWNVNWSPYDRYTAATHWACPASSGCFQTSLLLDALMIIGPFCAAQAPHCSLTLAWDKQVASSIFQISQSPYHCFAQATAAVHKHLNLINSICSDTAMTTQGCNHDTARLQCSLYRVEQKF